MLVVQMELYIILLKRLLESLEYNTIQKILKNPKFPNYYVKFGNRQPKFN